MEVGTQRKKPSKLILRQYFNNESGKNYSRIGQIRDYFRRILGYEMNTEEVYDYLADEYEEVYGDRDDYEIREDIDGNVKMSDKSNDRVRHDEIIEDLEEPTPFTEENIDNYIDIIEKTTNWIKKYHRNYAVQIDLIGYFHNGEEKIGETRTGLSVSIQYLNNLMDKVREILNNNKIKAPKSDVVFLVETIRYKLVRVELGGHSNQAKNIIVDGMKMKSFPSTNNNCLFRCIEDYKKIKISKSECDAIRLKYNLKPNQEIPSYMVSEIVKKEFDISMEVFVNNENKIENLMNNIDLKNANCSVFLNKNHYYIITGERGLAKKKVEKDSTGVKKVRLKKEEFIKNNFVIHYDIETYWDRSNDNTHTPYIIGFCYFDGKSTIYEELSGDDCITDFYKLMKSDKFKDYKYINSYNGSRFDNHFLFKTLLIQEGTIGEFIINNGAIISLKFAGKDLIDLNQHIQGSLKDNLKEYGCNISKGEINHNLSKRWEETDDARRKEVSEYLKCDVLGLCELYEKINQPIFEEFEYNLCDFMTGSQLYWKAFKNKFSDFEDLKPLNHNLSSILRNALYGGRTEVFKKKYESKDFEKIINGELKYDEIDDYMMYLDKVSLYPYVMSKEFYPTGKCFATNIYNKDKLGIYEIEYISNKKLLIPVLPRRENKQLIWDLKDSKGWYSSVDIENALKRGYKINIIQGYYWSEKKQVFKKYIEHMFKKKENAVKGSNTYNMYKVGMNAIYGKTMQRDIFKKSKIVDNVMNIQLLMKNNDVYIDSIRGTGKTMIEYEPIDINSEESKKPVHMGIFILAYSRQEMLKSYDLFNTKESMMYNCDTDSLFVENKYCNKIKYGNKIGDLSNDLKNEGRIIKAIFIAPKLYSLIYINNKNEIKYKFVGKGIQNNKLNWEHYELMLKNNSIKFYRDFAIKKMGLKNNFRIKHIESIGTEKEINSVISKKRNFIDNNLSYPLHYNNK
jgi:hypothetical protein